MEKTGAFVSRAASGGEMEEERETALNIATSAFALNKISIEEYEARAEKIQKALSVEDIRALTADLPRAQPPEAPQESRARSAPARRPEDFYVEERDGSPEFSLCVMGERKLTGDWLNSDSAASFTLMGSTVIDLRDTALPPGRLKIEAIALMGEIKIIVPEGLPVKMSAFPFMGEANLHSSVARRIDKGEPWVDVSGIAFMGSITVTAR